LDEPIHAATGISLPGRLLAIPDILAPKMLNETLVLATVVASISFTVTEMKIFRGLREWAAGKSRLFGELLSCSYCFGHWVAFALVFLYGSRMVKFWPPLDYFLTAIFVAWLAAAQCMLMCILMDRAGK